MPEKTTLGEVELLILLAVLRLEEDAHGVAIAREIDRRAGRSLRRATIYLTLQRLERHGLVSSWLGEARPEPGGKARRHYRVESEGVELVRRTGEAVRGLWSGLEPVLGGGAP